jgi:hypothetical protein
MVEAAIALMRTSGLSGAGINEVIRTSGAQRGSVHYCLPLGKIQLAPKALTTYSTRVTALIDDLLTRGPFRPTTQHMRRTMVPSTAQSLGRQADGKNP